MFYRAFLDYALKSPVMTGNRYQYTVQWFRFWALVCILYGSIFWVFVFVSFLLGTEMADWWYAIDSVILFTCGHYYCWSTCYNVMINWCCSLIIRMVKPSGKGTLGSEDGLSLFDKYETACNTVLKFVGFLFFCIDFS